MISHERLLELLKYDPSSGEWTWRVNRLSYRGKAKAGARAGWLDRHGRWRIGVDGRDFLSAPLAFFYMTGEWTAHDVDHKNGDKADDRWENLRPATRSQNNYNKGIQANNSTGIKGVSHWRAKWGRQKYQAYINVDGKRIPLGLFYTLEDAAAARKVAEIKYHGEYARGVAA